ncbi:MAG: ribosome small subunit-dependent GTPase A, partial [Nitrososphaeraceae archaeon]|nr:ribosome small subunit-dependent GTPase A [Nitrososphaeraceae archaeon]
ESSKIDARLVINKSDLDKKNVCEHWSKLYKNCDYPVFVTSTIDATGINELKNDLIGFKNLFWGQSGVGKSSLFNKMFPDLNLKISAISETHSKGTHTTVTSIMISVYKDTYIIDTPGVREIDPYGIRKEDVGHYFKEFSLYINQCKFNTCTHHHEPGCKIKGAVETGKITEERYESYLRIIDTIEDDINFK